MRRGLVALVCAGVFAAPADAALSRSTVDRLDEARGPQIHVIYAVPADGADRRLDETGALEGSLSSFQAWLAAQTGRPNLRFDTYQGSLDVSFLRLAATGRLGTRALRAFSVSFAASAARCRWRFPAGSKGKRFSGTVSATVGGASVSRSLTRTLR